MSVFLCLRACFVQSGSVSPTHPFLFSLWFQPLWVHNPSVFLLNGPILIKPWCDVSALWLEEACCVYRLLWLPGQGEYTGRQTKQPLSVCVWVCICLCVYLCVCVSLTLWNLPWFAVLILQLRWNLAALLMCKMRYVIHNESLFCSCCRKMLPFLSERWLSGNVADQSFLCVAVFSSGCQNANI